MTRQVVAGIVGLCLSASVQSEVADSYYDPAEMAKARAAVKASHGAQSHSFVLGERLEFRSNEGDPELAWQAQAWIGGDEQKLWLKTEGEYETDNDVEQAELQVLYSRAVSAFWDLQAGVRHDIRPNPSRTYAVLGLQGLAPYWIELDGALFLSDKGDFSARFEAEYEIRLAQRLLVQPRIELNLGFSDAESTGRDSGLSSAEAGLRLRYELSRAVAPYLGVNWSRSYGRNKQFQSLAEDDASRVSLVAGIRFWF